MTQTETNKNNMNKNNINGNHQVGTAIDLAHMFMVLMPDTEIDDWPRQYDIKAGDLCTKVGSGQGSLAI